MSGAARDVATLSREEAPPERTWDPESVFGSLEAWEAELECVLADLPSVTRFAGRLGDGPAVLLEALTARDELVARADRVSVYAYLGYAVETTSAESGSRLARVRSMRGDVAAGASFLRPELLALGREHVLSWLAEDEALGAFDHYVEDLFRQETHVRSSEVEEALGLVSDPFSSATSVYSLLVDSDLRFAPAVAGDGTEVPVSQGTVPALLSDVDRALRKSAWESYADGHLSVRNTLAASVQTVIKQHVFQARVRRHASSLEAGLAGSNVPIDVFDNAIDAFRANVSTWHRFWRVRRDVMGVEELHPYDVSAPLGPPLEVTYEQAVEWICDALAPLGEEYVETMRRGCLEERWVDVYPTVGKMGGAFSSGTQGTRPFIVMSFDGTAKSLGILAHELGHSMHSLLAWKAQPPVYAGYSLFAAEVASNFHQVLLRAHLLDTLSDRAARLAVLDEAFANFHRYLFLMPILARFERDMHERVERGDGLSAQLMGETMADLFEEGFGPDVSLDRERVGITWAQFPHLTEPFYVYQYTTGISGAHVLAEGVLDGQEGSVERYLAFLSAGGSRYPLDALAQAGVDMSTPAAVESAFGELSSLVDRVEELS